VNVCLCFVWRIRGWALLVPLVYATVRESGVSGKKPIQIDSILQSWPGHPSLPSTNRAPRTLKKKQPRKICRPSANTLCGRPAAGLTFELKKTFTLVLGNFYSHLGFLTRFWPNVLTNGRRASVDCSAPKQRYTPFTRSSKRRTGSSSQHIAAGPASSSSQLYRVNGVLVQWLRYQKPDAGLWT